MFPIKQFLEENKNWLIMALLIFFGGAALCYLPSTTSESVSLDQLLGAQLESLEHIINTLQGMPPPVLVLLIFINNFISMGQMLLLGFLAGLSPLFTLFVNGAVIGNITYAISQ
ncbi:MAG TPA: stage II sporulation protein M, partial [Firmicutes bacterium]|nr:stage II sporulation protein M [Bacillota bacterium]